MSDEITPENALQKFKEFCQHEHVGETGLAYNERVDMWEVEYWHIPSSFRVKLQERSIVVLLARAFATANQEARPQSD